MGTVATLRLLGRITCYLQRSLCEYGIKSWDVEIGIMGLLRFDGHVERGVGRLGRQQDTPRTVEVLVAATALDMKSLFMKPPSHSVHSLSTPANASQCVVCRLVPRYAALHPVPFSYAVVITVSHHPRLGSTIIPDHTPALASDTSSNNTYTSLSVPYTPSRKSGPPTAPQSPSSRTPPA
jgi:hypothetical protein